MSGRRAWYFPAAALAFLTLTVPAVAAAPASPGSNPPSNESASPPAAPDQLLVGYVAGATEFDRGRARSRANARVAETVYGGAEALVELVLLPRGSDRNQGERRLEEDPAVRFAEPNWIVTHGAASTDRYYTNGSLWGMYGDGTSPANQYGSQAGEAWASNVGNDTVYVGVIDEGIQVTHPDLNDNIWTNPFDPTDGRDTDGNGYVDDVNGWDFYNGDNSVYDGGRKGTADKHGTHVAGTIGAESNGTGVVGVNWNVTLISGKFLGRNGGYISDAVKAVDYFTDLKTRHLLNIVATNNSWGGGGYAQAMFDAISRAEAADILFIAAAGNDGTNNDTAARYPANFDLPNVIAVAAIDMTGARASWSNYGATKVHLGAPGVGIYSTLPNNTYASYSGTSMASPHVTGGAALYASTHPGASAATIKSAILSSSVPTPSLAGKSITGGRLNVSAF